MTSETMSLQEQLSRRVWLNCCRLRRCGSTLPEGVVLVNHHMHKELAFFESSTQFNAHFVRLYLLHANLFLS